MLYLKKCDHLWGAHWTCHFTSFREINIESTYCIKCGNQPTKKERRLSVLWPSASRGYDAGDLEHFCNCTHGYPDPCCPGGKRVPCTEDPNQTETR